MAFASFDKIDSGSEDEVFVFDLDDGAEIKNLFELIKTLFEAQSLYGFCFNFAPICGYSKNKENIYCINSLILDKCLEKYENTKDFNWGIVRALVDLLDENIVYTPDGKKDIKGEPLWFLEEI